MMFDFDKIIERRNTDSLKWNVLENELPMWVADMDFESCPSVREALQKKVDQGIYGYSVISKEWYEAYVSWWKNEHDILIPKDYLSFSTGVIPVISSAVRRLTHPNENVIIQTPVYNIFCNSILNNGARVLENPLKYNIDSNDYDMDFEDLEKKLALPQTTLMILCNPQNPAGKIWSRSTLEKVGALCKKYQVNVICDEIHCDIVEPGKKYVPFASVSEDCREVSITCIAPTKAFNIAGLQTAAFFSFNKRLFNIVNRGINTDEVAEGNVFAVDAAVAAFTKGREWLCQLNKYIQENKEYAASFIASEIPAIKITKTDATYLLWADISALSKDSVTFCKFVRKNTGLYISNGLQYGSVCNSFVRINVACPKSVLQDGLSRLKKAVSMMNN